MVRSIVLRGFDVQIAGLIENHMKGMGINFIGPSVPIKIEKLPGLLLPALRLRSRWKIKSVLCKTR